MPAQRFQSRTGSPGHLAGCQWHECTLVLLWFQSRTGSPGHLASDRYERREAITPVSIPDGLPRPFSRESRLHVSLALSVSIPDGLPRPFSRESRLHVSLALSVSIPDGL